MTWNQAQKTECLWGQAPKPLVSLRSSSLFENAWSTEEVERFLDISESRKIPADPSRQIAKPT